MYGRTNEQTNAHTNRHHFIPFLCPPSDTLLRIPLHSKKQPSVASFVNSNWTPLEVGMGVVL